MLIKLCIKKIWVVLRFKSSKTLTTLAEKVKEAFEKSFKVLAIARERYMITTCFYSQQLFIHGINLNFSLLNSTKGCKAT